MKDAADDRCRTALFAAKNEDVVKETIQVQEVAPDRKITEPNKQARDAGLAGILWKLTDEV
ncbi:hypothetical protein K432DRAFT_386563 [Lepidopterella palustris CBS 459.81]|uniref:Uncharacterized protein n=1 Tax=Lepidopterella palustris CBS 459.81 TaxID=1314670 RepID=A0A8E2E0A3_9PEZI|nr:hypothetical protein K432DRAFT_386563 [Lepidopterella palustris CBS 459.81]